MNSILMLGSGVVTLALIFYSIAVITEQKRRIITPVILIFISLGLFSDILSTLLMIIGSNYKFISFHGVLGYSALAGMLIDTVMIWKLRLKKQSAVSSKLHLYTRIVYIWWVLAYISGSVIGMMHLY
ncbi:MAG: hypothetical protein HXX14_14950 [Bacteroidetes bacterium]|nr:hypothetical protein [Bacteroidota bacterium]